MLYILTTILGYLGFNLAVWVSLGIGGMQAMSAANLLGAAFTALFFRREIFSGGKPKIYVALSGSFGIWMIVQGLRGSHQNLPMALSVEAVYNGFAIFSWPMFLLLGIIWSKKFSERPNIFDLFCHLLMAVMVVGRFSTYPSSFHFTGTGLAWILLAIAGYALFNISIKLSGGSRLTNVLMNVGGAVLLFISAPECSIFFDTKMTTGVVLGGSAVFVIVWSLGKSYQVFGANGQSSLVAPLIYDGLLIVSPLLSLVTGESISFTGSIFLGFGMLLITFIRVRWHTKPVRD